MRLFYEYDGYGWYHAQPIAMVSTTHQTAGTGGWNTSTVVGVLVGIEHQLNLIFNKYRNDLVQCKKFQIQVIQVVYSLQ